MKIFSITILITWIILGGIACNNLPANENNTISLEDTTASTLLIFHIDSLVYHREYGDCNQPDSPCVQVDINYPVIKGGQHQIADSINAAVHREVIGMAEEEGEISSGNIDSLAKDFIRQFITIYRKFPLATGGQWFITIKGEVMNQTPKILSIALTDFNFAGGAHPNTYKAWLNYDLQSGQLLHLADVLTDTSRVIQLAEKKFRAKYHIPSGSSLNAAGFMFNKDQFSLPANFIAYPDSLRFLYNNYEIAPYVYGEQMVTLTAGELGKLYQQDRLK